MVIKIKSNNINKNTRVNRYKYLYKDLNEEKNIKKIKKYKLKKKKKLPLLIFFISLFFIIISSFQIIKWTKDNKSTNKETNKITDNIKVKKTNKDTKLIEQNNEIANSNPYWDFIKMKLIDVDLNELKKQNNETVGWIQVKGTNINYPFVQHSDNSYYLSHDFSKNKNNAGWLFLDYRNNINQMNKNTIIYGHGRLDKTMFGSLKNIFKSDWLNDQDNYVIFISTEKENTMWQVFSTYRIKTTSDYLRINFQNDNDYQNFLDMITKRSEHNFNTPINTNDNILTLSTCYNNEKKVVLHAKLIKYQKK